MARFDILHEIERLDPERDHQRIVHLSFGFDFSWDSIRSLEIALYRTYCVPSESVSLNFRKIEVSYQRRLPDGTLADAAKAGWDLAANKKA